MILQLNNSIKKDLKKDYVKTINVVMFLIDNEFETNLPINETSLSDLIYKGKKIKKAGFKNDKMIIKF